MFLQTLEISPKSSPSDIVKQDYRTADIFRKYGIEYCCAGRWPLDTVCMTRGIEPEILIGELHRVTHTTQLPAALPFENWGIDFLIDYIVNVHHHYLVSTLPALGGLLLHFAEEHAAKYPQYNVVCQHFSSLEKEIFPHIRQEEEVIFPYLRQVAHAYAANDSFAGLLVKTLRKPVAKIMEHDHTVLTDTIYQFRELTGDYTPPAHACTNHHVILSKLKELDNDLVQHIYLENGILFPRIIAMEKELLETKA
jgi:regulator of cell morphogenesis and NO signaling